jgi:hypothetical protein
LDNLLNNGVPFFTGGALPYPFGILGTTILAKKGSFGFGHGQQWIRVKDIVVLAKNKRNAPVLELGRKRISLKLRWVVNSQNRL